MRSLLFYLLACLFLAGCAPRPAPKPSPYRYKTSAPSFSHGAHRKDLQ